MGGWRRCTPPFTHCVTALRLRIAPLIMPTTKKPAAKSAVRKSAKPVARAAKKPAVKPRVKTAAKPLAKAKQAAKAKPLSKAKPAAKTAAKQGTVKARTKPPAKPAAKPALKLPRPAIKPSINVFATPFPGNPFLAPAAAKPLMPLPPPATVAGEDKRFCSSCQTRKPIQKGSYKTSRDGRHRRWICVDCLAKKISR